MEAILSWQGQSLCNSPWQPIPSFPILVFNDQLRGPLPGSMALVPSAGVNAPGYSLPAPLGASLKQLVVEKLPYARGFDLAVRDSNTGFTFFTVQGHHYDYDTDAQSLTISNGRLLISKEFANALGRPSDAGSVAGTISIGAAMQPIEVMQLEKGQPQSVVMPPLQHPLIPRTPVAPHFSPFHQSLARCECNLPSRLG
jgi:hypothetical protein